jgi:hypothetical protein
MIRDDYFKIQNEFVENISMLSGNAVKLYLVLRRAVNEGRDDGNKVFPSYTYITNVTGMDRKYIHGAIEELIKSGWIFEVRRGNRSVNVYFLNDSRTSVVDNCLLG